MDGPDVQSPDSTLAPKSGKSAFSLTNQTFLVRLFYPGENAFGNMSESPFPPLLFASKC